ncbi:hypothetical protein Tco_0285933 [Tanacetum coccineum]
MSTPSQLLLKLIRPRYAVLDLPDTPYRHNRTKGYRMAEDLDAYSIGTTLHNDSLPKKEKDPGSFTLPCYINNLGFEKALADLGASDFIVSRYARGCQCLPLDPQRPFFSIAHTNWLLRRNRVDDLEPTIEEGEVVNKPMIDIVKTRSDFIIGLNDYPSECDFDRRIHIDCAYNLKFSYMIGFEYVHANFLPIFPMNVMSKKFYNTIMKEKIEFRGRNELGNFVNALVFIGNFYVITDFTVVEDMGPYLDKGMGDLIVGEPFARLRV